MSLRVRILAAVIAAVAAVPFVMPLRVAHAQSPGFAEYPLPSGADRPLSIATGSDHNLWFTELTGPNIGTVTPAGAITEYAIPSYSGFLGTGGIAAGPDNNLWFTDLSNDTVGKITTAGAITEYAALSTANAYPESITAGPDGNLWFTEQNANFVGRVTTGGVISEYAITANAGSQQIAAGPDGNIWFAEQSLDKIARVTPGGTVTEFQLATGSQPAGVVAGPDGNLWVAEQGTGNIDKVSTSSGTAGTVLAQYPLLTGSAQPQSLTVGADNNLWFSEYGGNTIGRITTAGVVSEYSTGESGSPFGITAGPDGNIWYTEYHGGAVGKLSLNACANLADSAAQSPVGTGGTESISVTLSSCGVAPLTNATTASTTTVPSGCPAAPSIPSFSSSLTYGQTDPHSTTFAAPSCPGTYTVTSQTTIGATVAATAQASYTVLAVGGGVLYPTINRPGYITAGSDGNLWWTDSSFNVNQITPSGAITTFQNILPRVGGQIVAGTDGSLYVVVTVHASYDSVAQVQLNSCCGPSLSWQVPAGAGTTINDLEPGIDGNVWFVAGSGNPGIVGFVTPGAKFKDFNLPAGSGVPQSITAGPDNAMWFTLDSGKVGRITSAGAVSLFAMPAGISAGNIALGPDGNLWITSGHHTGDGTTPNYVLRMTSNGVFKKFATPTPDVGAGWITTGADGNLWFNEPWLGHTADCPTGFGSGVGRVTPAGVITEFGAGCNDTNDTFNIVAGPDGNVWNAAYYGGGINMAEVGWSGACTPLGASVHPLRVSPGSMETLTASVSNCATTLRLLKVQSKTTPPTGCGAPVTTTTHVPLWPHAQTVVSNAVTASTCRGTYVVKVTLSSGGSVLATKTVTYKVT